VLSSDFCRGLVSDNENDQAATGDAFETLHFIARKRLARGLLTVIDATNVQPESRKPLVEIAREYHLCRSHCPHLPERLCQDRNQDRPDRSFGRHVVRSQTQDLRRSLRGLEREGFRHVFTMSSVEEVDGAEVVRQPLWNNLKHEHGHSDIIGDVHGCFDDSSITCSIGLLKKLPGFLSPPPGGSNLRGDLVDRGQRSRKAVRL